MEKFLLVSNIGLWVFLLIEFVAVLLIAKLFTDFLERTDTLGQVESEKVMLGAGKRAPYFSLPDQNGLPVAPVDLQGGRLTVLLFMQDTCGLCKGIFPKLPELNRLGLDLRLMVVEQARTDEPATHAPDSIHYVRSREVASHYQISQTPSVMLISPTGMILKSAVISNFKELEANLLSYFEQMAS